jgi:hypothetical protein
MILYKYGGGSGLKILEDLRLKITPPIEFNDPFEITPNTKRARPFAEMAVAAKTDSKYFRDVYDNMVQDGKDVGPFDQFIKNMAWAIPAYYSPYKKLTTSEMIKRDMLSLAEFSSHFGVLCLSTPPKQYSDVVILWKPTSGHRVRYRNREYQWSATWVARIR